MWYNCFKFQNLASGSKHRAVLFHLLTPPASPLPCLLHIIRGIIFSVRGFLRSRFALRDREATVGRRRLAAVAFLAGVIFLPMLRTMGGAVFGGGGGLLPEDDVTGWQNGGMSAKGQEGGWEAAPRVDLVCRTYGGSLHIMWNTFLPTYLVSTVLLYGTVEKSSLNQQMRCCTSVR